MNNVKHNNQSNPKKSNIISTQNEYEIDMNNLNNHISSNRNQLNVQYVQSQNQSISTYNTNFNSFNNLKNQPQKAIWKPK
jgi:hypothetical protein